MSHDMTLIAETLRQDGYRVTPQRQLVIDTICALGGHVTPEATYEQIQETAPTMSRATVYRNLHFLTERGVLTATQQGNGRLAYELAGQESQHHHLACRSCGQNFEVDQAIVQPLYDRIQNKYDFEIDMNHITFFGICAGCEGGSNDR